jgi:6-phosphogluconolactonase
VTAWSYDPARGLLSEIQTISSLPAGFTGTNYPADVQVHASGKFVYGSNRGHDSIVAYAVDPASGKLSLVGFQGEGVKNPRNFGIDPTGRFMLVASQDANTVRSFRIDPNTGALSPTGSVANVAKPVCVKFWTGAE